MSTPADICANCGHTQYVHPPNDGCDVASHYYAAVCDCPGFKDGDE